MNLSTYMRIKTAEELSPVEAGYFDNEFFPSDKPNEYSAKVRDYKPYEEAAIKNKKHLDDAYGLGGGIIGGTTGAGLGWYGTDLLLRNAKLNDRAKTTAKALGALGLGTFGVYAGDTFGRQLSPGVTVDDDPTITLKFKRKADPVLRKTIDTKFL